MPPKNKEVFACIKNSFERNFLLTRVTQSTWFMMYCCVNQTGCAARFLVEEDEGANGEEEEGQGRLEVLAVVGVVGPAGGAGGGRGARRSPGAAGAAAGGGGGGAGARGGGAGAGAGDTSAGRGAAGRARGLGGRGAGARGDAASALVGELRGVVGGAGAVLDLKGVGARGEVLGGPGEGSARVGGVDDLDVLQVGLGAVLEGDGDGTLGAGPLKGEGLTLGDLIVRVGELDLGLSDGSNDCEDGGGGELHFDGLLLSERRGGVCWCTDYKKLIERRESVVETRASVMKN